MCVLAMSLLLQDARHVYTKVTSIMLQMYIIKKEVDLYGVVKFRIKDSIMSLRVG